MALPQLSTRKQRVAVMGDMGDLEQVAIIKKVATNRAREDEMEIFEHMLKNDPKCLRQTARLRTEYDAAAKSPKSSDIRREQSQQKARRLRVAIKRVTVDGKHLPPRGPPLIPDDTFPVKAHTPHSRRADEAVRALHGHRAYKDHRFRDYTAEEEYHFNESAFNHEWENDEAQRRIPQQASTEIAQIQSVSSETALSQAGDPTPGPSARPVGVPVARDDAARAQAARVYHNNRLQKTINRDEAQARRLMKAENTYVRLDKAQSIVDAEREHRRAQRRAERAKNEASQAEAANRGTAVIDARPAVVNPRPPVIDSQPAVVDPQPVRVMEQPWQPAAQIQRPNPHRPDPVTEEIVPAPEAAHQTGSAGSHRHVQGPRRRASVIQRMGQAAAQNWRQGHFKEQVKGMNTGETQPKTFRHEAPPLPPPRRVPNPSLAAIGKLGGAVANRWRQGGYPPELKAAEKAERDALRAQRQAEAQARGDEPRPSAAKRLGGAMAALRRGRPRPPPTDTPQVHSSAYQTPSDAPRGTPRRVPAPTSPSRLPVPGYTVGIASEAELRGVSPQGPQSRVMAREPSTSFSDARPTIVGAIRHEGESGSAAPGQDVPRIRATASSEENMSQASSAPSFRTFAQEGVSRQGRSRARTANRSQENTDRQSESPSRPTNRPAPQPQEGAERNASDSPPRAAALSHRSTGRSAGGSPPRRGIPPQEVPGRSSSGSPPRNAAQPQDDTGRQSGESVVTPPAHQEADKRQQSAGSQPRPTARDLFPQPRDAAQQGPYAPAYTPPRGTPPSHSASPNSSLRSRFAPHCEPTHFEGIPPTRYVWAPSDEGPYREAYGGLRVTPRPEPRTSRDRTPRQESPAWDNSPLSRLEAQPVTMGPGGGRPQRYCSVQPPSDEPAYRRAYGNMRVSPRPSPRNDELARDASSPPRSPDCPPPILMAPGSPTVNERRERFKAVDQSPQKVRPSF